MEGYGCPLTNGKMNFRLALLFFSGMALFIIIKSQNKVGNMMLE